MKRFCIVLGTTCLLFACTVSHENSPEAIVFGEVVGNFTGTFKECIFSNATPQDSTCQSLIPETLRVTIADRQHIQIKSQSGHIPALKLQFWNEKESGTERQLEFQLSLENQLYVVLVRTSKGTLEYYSGSPVPGTGKAYVFSGQR